MLTPKERIRLMQLEEKSKEIHQPLTADEITAFFDRAEEYGGMSLGNLQGMTEFLNSLQARIHSVVQDNVRLLQDVEYYRDLMKQYQTPVSSSEEGEPL
jgi:hypothetical protein